jgi:predicted CXXCH cytochrome family protein
VRRWALLIAGGAVWLLLAAAPVFADGGPHVMTVNNGSLGITADSCAGCHRAHTSQDPTGYLLTTNQPSVTAFCLTCHGTTGTGAATDVETGVQYALTASGRDGLPILGALRSGGFLKASIGSADAYREVSSSGSVSKSKVPVLVGDPQPVTSAHLALPNSGLTASDTVWGNGATDSGAGAAITEEMECTSCHNPHGNGNYRILNAIPVAGATNSSGAPTEMVAGSGQDVLDAPYDPARQRNYTVIQTATTQPTDLTTPPDPDNFLLYADQLTGRDPLSGDYLHKTVPYNVSTSSYYWYDAPNGSPNRGAPRVTGQPSSDFDTFTDGFNWQMTQWCLQCHSRYAGFNSSRSTDSGDDTFTYRHSTEKNRVCTTCHVAHGSNAVMNQDLADGTTFSANVPFPDASVHSGDSRLLKVNNRGTCLLCHDPTKGSATGPQGTTPTLFP